MHDRQPVISDCGINNEEFHMVLPYKEIKEIVEYERERYATMSSDINTNLDHL